MDKHTLRTLRRYMDMLVAAVVEAEVREGTMARLPGLWQTPLGLVSEPPPGARPKDYVNLQPAMATVGALGALLLRAGQQLPLAQANAPREWLAGGGAAGLGAPAEMYRWLEALEGRQQVLGLQVYDVGAAPALHRAGMHPSVAEFFLGALRGLSTLLALQVAGQQRRVVCGEPLLRQVLLSADTGQLPGARAFLRHFRLFGGAGGAGRGAGAAAREGARAAATAAALREEQAAYAAELLQRCGLQGPPGAPGAPPGAPPGTA